MRRSRHLQKDRRSAATSTVEVAEKVILGASRSHPADALLRSELKKAGLPRHSGAEISRAVFAYFRWKGWLDSADPIRTQIERATTLARQFAEDSRSFSDEDLLARALPTWLAHETQVSPELVRSLQSEPRLWIRARKGVGESLSAKLGHCIPHATIAEALEYTGEADLFRTPEYTEGLFEIQDISSQAVGLVCSPKPGETWWDACAGEGGKLLQLSDLMESKGLIWASDRADWRLRRLKRRAARARVFNYRMAAWNGGAKLPTNVRFDGVLVDAPCTGTGTWGRNPHARWTTSPQDVVELSQVQLNLLTHAAQAVKPGGKLVYSVCTLTRSETTDVAESFERRAQLFGRLAVESPLIPGSGPGSELVLRPEKTGGNGMYIACWARGA